MGNELAIGAAILGAAYLLRTRLSGPVNAATPSLPELHSEEVQVARLRNGLSLAGQQGGGHLSCQPDNRRIRANLVQHVVGQRRLQ